MSTVGVDGVTTLKMTNPTSRRHQHYIKGRFQRNFILQFLVLILIGCAAFAASVYFYSNWTLTTAFVDSKLRVMNTADFLLPALGFTALIVAALLSVGAAIRLLFFSHQIAGPLYRLEKTVQQIAGGNLNFQVKLRSRDELQDFARAMDVMVSDLRTHVRQIKNQSDRLREKLVEANHKSEMPKDLFESLRKTQDELDEAISRFQA